MVRVLKTQSVQSIGYILKIAQNNIELSDVSDR